MELLTNIRIFQVFIIVFFNNFNLASITGL